MKDSIDINFAHSVDMRSLSQAGHMHRLSKKLTKAAKILAVVGVFILVVAYAPSVWYLITGGSGSNTEVLGRISTSEMGELAGVKKDEVKYQPKIDTSLPNENRIVIASAGIDTQINEATLDTYEEALKKGVWRVADFGDPYTREKPTIMAAHRFGYLKWSMPYRLKNSFLSLPKLEVGETVEVYWRQRKYVYEVYAEEKGDKITDYSADLILYTCESLSSPVRIFRYARLLEV